MIIHLPFPPSANTYYRNFRGRMVMSQKGRDYKQAVADHISSESISGFGSKPLKMMLFISAPNRRSYDLDNRFKAVLDSLQDAGIYDNDSQINELSIMRCPIVKGGKLMVLIEEIKDADIA